MYVTEYRYRGAARRPGLGGFKTVVALTGSLEIPLGEWLCDRTPGFNFVQRLSLIEGLLLVGGPRSSDFPISLFSESTQ
jgi:hypothetical protein